MKYVHLRTAEQREKGEQRRVNLVLNGIFEQKKKKVMLEPILQQHIFQSTVNFGVLSLSLSSVNAHKRVEKCCSRGIYYYIYIYNENKKKYDKREEKSKWEN